MVVALLESIDIRGSIHDDAQIKSSSTSSMVIALNNFMQYSHCQDVQLFRVKAFTKIIPKLIVCPCVMLSD